MQSNIVAIARAICERQLRPRSNSASELATNVDRYWHCVAAQIEGGTVDDEGNRVGPFDLERELAAYRDYMQRHKKAQTPSA
jgi:hypothetical protein